MHHHHSSASSNNINSGTPPHQQATINNNQQQQQGTTTGHRKKNKFGGESSSVSGGPPRQFTNVVVTTSPAFYSLNSATNSANSNSSNNQQQTFGGNGSSTSSFGGSSNMPMTNNMLASNNQQQQTHQPPPPKNTKPYKSLVSKPNVQIKGTPQILAKKPSSEQSTTTTTRATSAPQPTILQKKNPPSASLESTTTGTQSGRRMNQFNSSEISQNFTSGGVGGVVNSGSSSSNGIPLVVGSGSSTKSSNLDEKKLSINNSSIVQSSTNSTTGTTASFEQKCLKLIQENSSGMYTNSILELQSNQYLQSLSNLFPNDKQINSETNNYSVIGVIGKQSSGKSTLLNSLIGSSSGSGGDSSKSGAGSGASVFPPEDLECFLDCKYKTSGIDVYRSSLMDQQIFIDTQPLFSSTLHGSSSHHHHHQSFFNNISSTGGGGGMSGGMGSETSVEAVSIAALESFIDITSLQIALFVFSVCHVVLVVIDHQADSLEQFKMYQFIQTVRMLQQGVPTISQCGKVSSSSSSSPQQKTTLEGHVPEIIFVYNKVRPSDMSELNVKHMESLLESYFSSCSFRKNGFIHPHMWHHQFKKNDSNVNFFMIPMMQSSKNKENDDLYKDSINLLRRGIQNMPKPNLKKMSQNEWFGNSVRNFEVIKKSYFLQEYIRKITSSMSIHN